MYDPCVRNLECATPIFGQVRNVLISSHVSTGSAVIKKLSSNQDWVLIKAYIIEMFLQTEGLYSGGFKTQKQTKPYSFLSPLPLR